MSLWLSRRFTPMVLILALLCAGIPAPASALSTQQEIAMGREYDKQVTDSNGVTSDPLLNSWVNDISQKIWAQVVRKDVPYNIKILDVPDVNAFTTLGGYVYINLGTLDFVQSDDELAGVIGHETGHDERRHFIQNQTKANILNLVFGIGSLFSPFLYRFGQLAQAGIMAKISRQDEIEADRYGLLVMTRAGYDPDAMVSFMRHLGAQYADHSSIVDKYFADHPGTNDRVKKLLTYEELDTSKRTVDQMTVAALHDESEGRYNIAAMDFQKILAANPTSTIAQLHLGEDQLALGQTSKSEQNLAAAASTSPETKALAQMRLAALRDMQRRTDLLHPNLDPLRVRLADARTRETQAATALASRRDSGRDQFKALHNRIQDLGYGVPDYSYVNVRPGSRLDTVLHNLNGMSRSIDTAINKASQTVGGVGSLELHRESGLLRDNRDILAEMEAPLKLDRVPPQAAATLSDYPRMLTSLEAADGDMVRGVDAARASIALLDVALGELDRFLHALPQVGSLTFQGDMSQGQYNELLPLMQRANDSLNRAAVAASQGAQLYNMARARQLQTRIDLLGLSASPDRYATLTKVLDYRFHAPVPDYDGMLRGGFSPGDIAASAVVAADTNTTPDAVLAEAKATGKSVVDIANGRGMSAQSLEIFMGLIWLSWTDDPAKEAQTRAPVG